MEIIVTAIPDGIPVRFAIGKRHGVNQEVVADFEEYADFSFIVCSTHQYFTKLVAIS